MVLDREKFPIQPGDKVTVNGYPRSEGTVQLVFGVGGPAEAWIETDSSITDSFCYVLAKLPFSESPHVTEAHVLSRVKLEQLTVTKRVEDI